MSTPSFPPAPNGIPASVTVVHCFANISTHTHSVINPPHPSSAALQAAALDGKRVKFDSFRCLIRYLSILGPHNLVFESNHWYYLDACGLYFCSGMDVFTSPRRVRLLGWLSAHNTFTQTGVTKLSFVPQNFLVDVRHTAIPPLLDVYIGGCLKFYPLNHWRKKWLYKRYQ